MRAVVSQLFWPMFKEHIFESQLWSACGTFSLHKFSVEVFRIRPSSMLTTWPSQRIRGHAGVSSFFQDSVVRDFVLSGDVQNASEGTHVKSIELSPLSDT